jgi:hypothetical protein
MGKELQFLSVATTDDDRHEFRKAGKSIVRYDLMVTAARNLTRSHEGLTQLPPFQKLKLNFSF